MNNITRIVPRKFGKVADLRIAFPGYTARAYAIGKRCVVVMFPRRCAKTGNAMQHVQQMNQGAA